MAFYTRTSPSQRGTFDLCKRRWYFGSILKLPQTESPDAAEGTRLHKQMEEYSLKGTEPTHPSCVVAKAWIAPPMTPKVLIEAKTTDPALYISGLLVNGRVDYFDGRDPDAPFILDFKSKSSKKGALSRNKLMEDTQLSIYGKWALLHSPSAPSVKIAHGYLIRGDETKLAGPVVKGEPHATDSKLVDVDLTAEHINATIDALKPGFEEMKLHAMAPNADAVPIPEVDHNGRINACWAFGQLCPYIKQCRPLKDATFETMFGDEGEDVSLISKLKEQPGLSAIPDPADFVGTPSATPAPVAATETSTGPKKTLLERLREMEAT